MHRSCLLPSCDCGCWVSRSRCSRRRATCISAWIISPLPSDELVRAKQVKSLQRNFQGYSTHAEHDLIGLGVSAIGKVGETYSQSFKTLPEYYAAIDSGHLPVQRGVRLSADDVIRRTVIQELMCHEVIDCAAIGRRYDIDFKRYFSSELRAAAGAAGARLDLCAFRMHRCDGRGPSADAHGRHGVRRISFGAHRRLFFKGGLSRRGACAPG